ncbi:MAG: hypothetical protein CENE_01037 [Candidatus Celerinatantimonas neptuna]|nr:MAG: hypothetical protein CENE_01037 [Candidatus Celerinatantimonas neptuna]
MKKKSLSFVLAIHCICWSLLSLSAFANTDITASQNQSVAQLKEMREMQAKYETELSKIRQLRQKYEDELKKLDTQAKQAKIENKSKYDSLKKKLESITIFGFVRGKYDHDNREGIGSGTNNKHFYMDLEGKMKVSESWVARFQSETRKGYTVNQSWREGDTGSDDQDGTFQRIWVEGNPYNIGIELGTKWWGLGFQNVPFGHAADGISVDYDFIHDWNAKAFWWRPRQGDLVSMPDGSDTSIAGANVTGRVNQYLETSLTYATNKNHNDNQKMSRMGALDLRVKAFKDIVLTGTYVRTNADDYNSSQEYRIDYKDANLEEVGSYGLYTRYIDFERYGDYSHDDEWGSLPTDAKGWIFGAKFIPFKNVVWETFFSIQRRNRASSVDHDAIRHLFRTQIDFHF